MMPFPVYGHVTPLLQLARQLVREHGFTITFLNSTHYHNVLMKSFAANEAASRINRGINFVHISDGLPDDHPRLSGNNAGMLMAYVAAVYSMEPVAETLLLELHAETPITCLIRDLHLSFANKSVREAGISVATFSPCSALKEYTNMHIRTLIDTGFLPDAAKAGDKDQTIDGKRGITCLPGVSPQIRVEDLPFWPPSVKGKLLHPAVVESVEKRAQKHVDSDWVLFNTVYELERLEIDGMRERRPNVCTVGPLNLVEYNGEENTVDWLNHQEPKSVVVLAFGTTAMRSIQQFEEIALGLEASQQKFLWVFNPEQVVQGNEGSDQENFLSFMSSFAERTQHQGHITQWVSGFFSTLRHPAVGAFVLHCGWNSVMEGISSGVPFIVWPFHYDQYLTARCVTDVYKIGLPLEKDGEDEFVTRDQVADRIRRILSQKGENPEIDEIRARSMEFRHAAEKAITKGGSSEQSLTSFVSTLRKTVQA